MTTLRITCGHAKCLASITAATFAELGPKARAAGWQLLWDGQRCPEHVEKPSTTPTSG